MNGTNVRRFLGAVKDRLSAKLANKLILLFSAIIILVVGSLTYISYEMLRKESVAGSIASTSNNLLLVNRNLEEYLLGMERLSLPQIRFDEIVYAITHESEDYASRMVVENYLRELYYSRQDLESIYLYVVKEKKYYAVTRESYNITVRTGRDAEIEGLAWYKRAMDSPRNRAYQSFAQSRAEPGYAVDLDNSFMAYHRVLRSIATREPQAVLSFYFNASVRDELLRDVPLDEGHHLLFLSPDNTPFYADEPAVYDGMVRDSVTARLASGGEGQTTWADGGHRYMVVYNIGEREGWKLVKPIPYTQLNAAAREARNISFSIGLAFLLLAIVAVTYVAGRITNPLKRLSHQMRRFSGGDFEAAAEVKGRDEIAYLANHFNRMVVRTNELINDRYKMKLVEKNAILKALEAEINPHFLYNALQAISTKALRHERYDIADMVDALAATLRYCISGKDIVRARDELRHIGQYMTLQKARFGSRLNVVTDWDERLLGMELPKLSVQTLVENAVKHGLEKVPGTVTIEIRARIEGGHAVISVRDDGPGFEPERLAQIRSSFDSKWEERENAGGSIGLVNLHTRLKLLYGDSAALDIKTDEQGTEMTLRLPRPEEE